MDIEVLEGLEAVRRRPERYLGPLHAPGMPSRLVLQGLCHAIDEAIDGACRSIRIDLGANGRAQIRYDVGMPLCQAGPYNRPAAHILLAVLWACQAGKKHVRVGDEACSVGLAVLNALSTSLTTKTVWRSKSCTLNYERGELSAEPRVTATSETDEVTIIDLQLDSELLRGHVDLDIDAMQLELTRWRESIPALPKILFGSLGPAKAPLRATQHDDED